MKEFAKNKILKTLTIIAIITTMLFSYVPMFVFAETTDEENTSSDNYVQLTANWQNTEGALVGKTSTNYAINYTLKLNGVQTGFKNVVMRITNTEYETPVAKITSNLNSNSSAESVNNYGSYSTINFGNENTGQQISGAINVNFGDNGTAYSKKLLITLTGTYIDPTLKEEVDFEKQIELDAQLTPINKVVNFVSNLNMENAKGENTNPSISTNRISAEYGYYATQVTAKYPIKIKAKNYAQKVQLQITFDRKYNNQSKISDGYTINWNGLDSLLGTPVEKVNEDGSVTYTFTKGEDSQTFDSNNVFSIDNHYNISITYKIPNTTNINPEQGSSTIYFKAEMETIGWRTETEYGKELVATKITQPFGISKSNGVTLSSYTPGQHTWVSMDWVSDEHYITEESINELVENRQKDFAFSAYTEYVRGPENTVCDGNLNHSAPILSYLTDEGKIAEIELNSNQIRLKQITGNGNLQLVLNENTVNLVDNNGSYTVPSGTNANEFYVTFKDFCNYNYSGYKTVYTLFADELGLSDNELKNIISLEIVTKASGSYFYEGGLAGYYNTNSEANEYSYMELNIGEDFNTSVDKVGDIEGPKTVTLSMKKSDALKEDERVVNINPVFFVQLPSDFKYSNIDVKISNNSISLKEIGKVITDSGETYISIVCEGTYDSSKMEDVDIIITYYRKLSSSSASSSQTIKTYMLTDNERYIYQKNNVNKFEKDGNIPSKIFATSAGFEITNSSVISASTRISYQEGKWIKPNPANNIIDEAEKEKPLAIPSNQIVKYSSNLEVQGANVTNVSIVSRLPIANNVNIENTSEKLLEDDYILPDEYFDSTEGSLKDITKGTAVNQISLTNLSNIVVYNNNRVIDSKNYTIYYSTDGTAAFDTSSYIEYEEGVSNLSNAKTLLVKFNDDYTIKSGEIISVQYEMTMPDEGGMVGAVTGVQFTNVAKSVNILNSPAAYVINGESVGKLKIQKKFEGYNIGVAPTGISLSGIEFKLENENGEFVKDDAGNDIIATTDEQGIATFTGIPNGEYTVCEITEFDDFSGIGDLVFADIEVGKTLEMTLENKYKKGTVIVEKTWQNTDVQQGTVIFTLTRNNGDKVVYTENATTNEEGKATFLNVPYGKYTVTETVGVDGWTATENKTVELHEETATVQMENRLSYTTLQIEKTVPQGETVDGLTFHITGTGMVNYIDKDGNTVLNNTDMQVKIGEDYSSNSNITVEKSDDNTAATITITNLPLGIYRIDEIDIPIIDGTDIEKYVTVSKQVDLTKDITLTNSPVVVNISNKYKYGYLQINKTAKLKEGDTYTDIGDLSSFEVRITGTSYYGNAVDQVISLDENGYGITKLEIGKYTVTEVASEGYTTYYGTNSAASTTPPEVTINYNVTTTQNLYNEHTGVGYVRVEKTLEGNTDPQKVLDAGIEFKVVGQNVAGGRVEETIKIDKIDTAKNVAYGVSGPISSGGEYELQEVESTVPNFYEGIEPIEINLKSTHTTEAPLVINAVNTRTKGNLEIVTQTYPAGGPLTGITYKVTEVEINKNGSYTKIGESLDIEGSNDAENPSFAILEEINSGYYLVEQVTVPDGWQKDLPQIVEVPSYNTGYANFEITQPEQLKQNKVTINKVVLNSNNEVVTDEELEKAKLNKNESFEVKITNIDTNEVFYVFTSVEEPGVIQGLDAGNYAIEEVYKPKYTTEGYYNNKKVEPNEIDGLTANIDAAIVEEKISQTNGKYIFTITENDNGAEDVTITVKNKINTDFGFGGQDSADNFSKVTYEKVQLVTKAIIYVVDENNNAISGAKFKLVNENGQTAIFNDSTEFEINNRKMTIKGLDVGKYTLICTQYPDGYLKPNDKEIIVYSDAVQVARVEIQKDIPRGVMLLSTVYTTEDDETKYVPRSKYKVVDKETGELVTFTRTSTGDYQKSNLPDASPVIVLKSGAVEVQGLEVGDYEVGIVDVTKGYGIQNELPEDVTIEQNATENVSVEVLRKNIVQVEAGSDTTMYLNESGELFIVGRDSYGLYGNGEDYYVSKQFQKIEFPEGVKITKFSHKHQCAAAVDTEGRVWTWGYNSGNGNLGNGTTSNIYTPQCVFGGNGTRIVDVELTYCLQMTLLDDMGQVWTCGQYPGNGTSTSVYTPICISTLNNDLYESYKAGVKIVKLANNMGQLGSGAIDSLGRVWMWGTSDMLSPVCISETTDLGSVEIVDFLITDSYYMALDKNGNIWLWGTSEVIQNELVGGAKTVPTKVDSSYFGNAKIKLITGSENINSSRGKDELAIVVDEYGKVWTWGNAANGGLGNGEDEVTTSTPICISDDETEKLYGVEIEDIAIGSVSYSDEQHIVVVDITNTIWAWGGTSQNGEAGQTSNTTISVPQKMTVLYNEHFEYNLKFKEVFTSEYGYSSYAIDEEGRLWVWGYGNSYGLGLANRDNVVIPTMLEIPGNPKMKKVSSDGSTIMLSEDGRVFVSGYDVPTGDGKHPSGALIEITNNFDLDENVIINDVYSFGDTFIAIDTEGKVYTWGDERSPDYLGRTDTENALTIECISDDENEILKDVKIVKIGCNDSSILAIDSNGNLYTWNSGAPSKVVNNTKFVDVKENFLLDHNGKIWRITSTKFVCLSDIAENPLYKYYKLDPEFKITKMYDSEYDGYEHVILEDSYGDLWLQYNTDTYVVKLEGIVSPYNHFTIIADAMPKDIISLSGHLLVDNYGQIWVYQNISNSYGEAGIGLTTSISGPTCLTRPTENISYDVKMKNIISDSLVVSETGALYEYKDNTPARIVGISPVEYIEGTLGIKVVQSSLSSAGYGNTNTNYELIAAIAIDENGKLWEGTYKSVQCLSDLAGTELAEKYENDKNFRIEKVYYYDSTKFAIDNYGKVWAWGYNSNGQCGNGATTTADVKYPTCISDIQGSDLYNSESNYKIESIEYASNSIIAKDNTGKVFVWGINTSGKLGDGTTTKITKPYCINTQKLDGKTIEEISLGTTGMILCTDGSVYISGDKNINTTTEWTLVGTCEGASKIFNLYGLYILSGENKVWAFGNNTNGICGTGNTADAYIKTPTLISEEFNISSIKRSTTLVRALDVNGKMWQWGTNGKPAEVTYAYKTVAWIEYNSTLYPVDDKGIVHAGTENDLSSIIKDIYGELTEENIIKFVEEMNNGDIRNSNKYINICIDGDLWNVVAYYTGTSIDSYNCVNTIVGSELAGKQVVDYSTYKALDSEGNLYAWSTKTGLSETTTYPICITKVSDYDETVFKANNTIINSPQDNDLYGIKIKELVNDRFVIDENDDIWYFTNSGKPTNISKTYSGDKNPLYGKEIIEVIDSYVVTEDNQIWYLSDEYPGYVMDAMSIECEYIVKNFSTVGYEYYIALDTNGKIWTCGVDAHGIRNFR